MNVVVEFNGVARVVTGVRQLPLSLDEGTTFRDLVRLLGAKFPSMIGQVIQPDGETFYPSNMLNLNGKQMIQPSQMHNSPQDGDRVILMSVLAGG